MGAAADGRDPSVLARLRAHLTYANVVSSLALFIAISGGVAFAVPGLTPTASVPSTSSTSR
jgi:hypothetical protein